MTSNIEHLREELDSRREAAKVATDALHNAEIALAEALCPFKVEQTIKTMWRNRETPAKVKAILPGHFGLRDDKHLGWRLVILPIKKDGTFMYQTTLSCFENSDIMSLNGIFEESTNAD